MTEETINLSEVLYAIRRRWNILVLTTVLVTIITAIVSIFIVSPTYEASTKVFIGKDQSEIEGYSNNDITMYQNLLQTYSELVKTKDLLRNSINNSDYNLEVEEVLDKLDVTTVSNTQMIKITYRSTSPKMAKNILENITNEFINLSRELVPNGNVRILEEVELPKEPIAPNKSLYIVAAMVLGFALGLLIVILIEYLDNTFSDKKELEEELNIPVLGVIPKFDSK